MILENGLAPNRLKATNYTNCKNKHWRFNKVENLLMNTWTSEPVTRLLLGYLNEIFIWLIFKPI